MHKISLIPKPKPKGAIRTRAKISFHKGAKNNTAQRSLLPLDRHLRSSSTVTNSNHPTNQKPRFHRKSPTQKQTDTHISYKHSNETSFFSSPTHHSASRR
ncbi:hypothetical protein PS2_013863 [Malus domestica]